MSKIITLQEANQAIDSLNQRFEPLRPPSVAGAEGGNVSYALLEQGLTVHFPFVEGMRVGGRYAFTLSAGVVFFTIQGQLEEEGADGTAFIPPEEALKFQGLRAGLSYWYSEYPVEDRISPEIQLAFEGMYYPPQVDEVVDRVLPLSASSQGATLRIKAGLAFTPNAVVSVYWVGSNSNGCFVRHVIVQGREDLIIPVEPRFIQPNKYGTVHLVYTVQSSEGRWTSSALEFSVAGDLMRPEAVYHNEIEFYIPLVLLPIDENGAIPFLLRSEFLEEGDVATLIFIGGYYDTVSVLRRAVTAEEINEGSLLFGVPIRYEKIGHPAVVLGVLERRSGEALGSPLLKLGIIGD